MVSYPNFRVVFGYIVGIDDLILIDFNIKVGNKNDNKIISDRIQTSVRVYSYSNNPEPSFIERLFY